MEKTKKVKIKNVKLEESIPQMGLDYFSDFYDFMDCSNYKKYAHRIKKSLYYGQIPSTDRPSLSVTGVLVDKFSEFCNKDGLGHLEFHEAASICYDACVTPCSVIVALLYLDRLRINNPEYLATTSPSQVFVVAMMVASKYLYDDGEEDEVFNDEWATSAAMMLMDLNQTERNFLSAIDWNLFVDISRFLDGLAYVEAEVSNREASSRGFYIYSDLLAITRVLPPIWNSFLKLVGSALVVCIVSYTATVGILTTGTLIGKHCSLQIASHLEQIYINPPLRMTNRSRIVNTLDATDDRLFERSFSLEASESAEEICSTIENCLDEEMQAKVANGKFKALHTLTTAILLASSSATNTLVDSISSLPMPNKSSFPWTSAVGQCLDCLANHHLPSSNTAKKVRKLQSAKKSNEPIEVISRRGSKRFSIKKRIKTLNVQKYSDRQLSSSYCYSMKDGFEHSMTESFNPLNINSGNRPTVISITESLQTNYILVTAKGISENIQKHDLPFLINAEKNYNSDFDIQWGNDTESNYTWFQQPINHILDSENPWFVMNKIPPSNFLELFSSWMWKSFSLTLSRNLHDIMNLGFQSHSMAVFI